MAMLEGTWIGDYRDYTFYADSTCVQTYQDNPSNVERFKYSIALMIFAMIREARLGRKKKDESDEYAALCPDFIESEE